MLFIAPLPPPHLPTTDPDNLGRLPPRYALGHRSQHHFLYLHRPLPGGFGASLHAASWQVKHLAAQSGHFMCYLNRTYDVLTTHQVNSVDTVGKSGVKV